MKFSFQRASNRFMNKLYIYLGLSFLIAIGTGILFIALSNLASENRLYKKTFKALQETTTIIEPSDNGLDTINYDDYLYLNEKYKDDMSIFYSANTKIAFLPGGEDLISIDCIFITDEEIKELSNLNFDNDLIIGKSAIENLEKIKGKAEIEAGNPPNNNQYIKLDADLKYDGDKITIAGESFDFKTIESKYETRVLLYHTDSIWNGTGDGVRLGYTLFIPIEKLEKYKSEFEEKYFTTRIALKEKNPNSNNLWEILDYLGEKHPGVNYKLNDQHARAKDRLGQMTWNANRYRILSIMLIFLVSIASSGLFYIIFYRRKKDIAVSIAVGSTFKMQAFELLLEIFYVVLFGFFIGISGGSMMADILKIEFKFEITAFLITFFVAILIVIASAFLSLNSLKNLSPISILQNE